MVKQALGEHSGFFDEYSSWAPVAAHLYDVFTHLLVFVSHPSLTTAVKEVFTSFVATLAAVVNLATDTIEVHHIHAKTTGTPLADAHQAVTAAIRLDAETQKFGGPTLGAAFSKIKDIQQKSLYKSQAKGNRSYGRGRGGDRGSGRRGRGGRGRGGGRDAKEASGSGA